MVLTIPDNGADHKNTELTVTQDWPRIMKLPVVRYSPEGAVLDTWSWFTHQALVTTLASHAALWQMAIVPASFSVLGGTGSPVHNSLMLMFIWLNVNSKTHKQIHWEPHAKAHIHTYKYTVTHMDTHTHVHTHLHTLARYTDGWKLYTVFSKVKTYVLL